MNPHGHRRAQELFEQAGALAAQEREAFLVDACAGDEELRSLVAALLDLESKAAAGRADVDLERGFPAAPAEPRLPERIGGYRVLARLGAGGMGVVYEAEQEHPRRRVALKLLRADLVSPEMLRRFELEAQVLGLLSHPGIARIFEAGTVDLGLGPQPFLAMERIEGEPLVAYARRRDLPLRACLELVARVCDAVHHAHQKGVIHRDLKPSNILVEAEGQPRILDFGVARATGADLAASTLLTRTGELVGTLPYMSPEQLGGDPAALDARCDVYAIGVLAYELLAGARPFEVGRKSIPEAVRTIVEEEPTRLGLVSRELAGDVETIVGKALEKDPQRRYGSAAELARDLRRHLADEPITARAPSARYKLGKFVRRNRAWVAGAAVLAVALVAGTLVSTVQAVRAVRAERAAHVEERRARFEAETAQAVTDYLVALFENANPEGAGSGQVTALELLERGVERIRGEFQDRPAIRERLLNVFGKIYNWLQRYDLSRPILEEALALTAQVHGEDSAAYADTLERLAQVHLDAEDVTTSESMQRRVLMLREKHLGKDHPLYTDALNNLAGSLLGRGAFEEAERKLVQARDLRIARLGADHVEVATVDHNLALLLQFQGRGEEAEPLLSRALASHRAHHGEDHWRTLGCRLSLADCLRLLGRTDEALEHARAAYEGLRDQLGEGSGLTARALSIYALCLQAGDPEQTVRIVRELLERSGGAEGGDAARSYLLGTLASTLHDLGRHGEAEERYLEALDLRGRIGAEGLQVTLEIRNNLSVLYQQIGRLDEALALASEVLAEREQILGLAHPDTRGTLNNLAAIHRKLGSSAAEEAIWRRKLAGAESELAPGSFAVRTARLQLAECLVRAGSFEEAEEILLAAWKSLDPERGDGAASVRAALVGLYTAWGRSEEVEQWTEGAGEPP